MSCKSCGKGTSKPGSHKGCICEAVRAIKEIQDVGSQNDRTNCPTSCFMEPLGGSLSPARERMNTRVFMLLTKDGTPFKAMHRGSSRNCYSVFFRVEEIFDNCCATLRVLEPLNREREPLDLVDSTETTLHLNNVCNARRFRATNSCITVDLSCFCGIQCVRDTFLNL